MIEGIENIQVYYGVDTDATQDYVPNYYVKASLVPATVAGVSGWTRVVSMRVNLLVVSTENNLVDDPQSYIFDGVTYTGYKRNSGQACSSSGGTNVIPCISARAKDTSQLCAPTDTSCVQVDDLRLRRVFSSTIVLRNRLP